MHCRKATQLISEGMDRSLTRRERVALRVHLLCCRPCRRFRRQLALIRNALSVLADGIDAASLVPGAALSPEARRRIGAAVADRAG